MPALGACACVGSDDIAPVQPRHVKTRAALVLGEFCLSFGLGLPRSLLLLFPCSLLIPRCHYADYDDEGYNK